MFARSFGRPVDRLLEQIIHAHIDRANKNAVVYTTGSIESPQINKYLVDVMEGTRPAFDSRGSRYYAN